jgi:hypothetical protein
MRIISADGAPIRQGLVQVAGLIDRVIKQVDYRAVEIEPSVDPGRPKGGS